MPELSRRHLVRGAAGLAGAAPAYLLLGSGIDDAVAAPRGCADADDLPLLLARDMIGKHEGRMHGVPRSYNWAKGPRVGRGNRPGRFRAMSVWGSIYEDAKGSPARNVRVAFILNLSVKTVDTHRAQIMDRLGIRDLAGLVLYALRRGIIKLDE